MPYEETKIDTFVREKLERSITLHQFGQSQDDAVWDGATACTHVCWQVIIFIWTGRVYSLNSINSLAGMPYKAKDSSGRPRGMRHNESLRLVTRLSLPYKLVYGQSMTTLRNSYLGKGPIIIPTRYGSQPDWRGYIYNGTRADGSPNGFAEKAGRTQLKGFEDGRHAIVVGLQRQVTNTSGVTIRSQILQRDPNHGSPARPERPPYDIISIPQVTEEYNHYRSLGQKLFAWVPTRILPV